MSKATQSSTTPSQLSQDAQYERVPIDQLYFDPRNPRLEGFLDHSAPSQQDLLRVLWQQMAVDELALSIAASGYFNYEPLFVSLEKGKLFVIEGNRRLAAVKLLLDAKLRADLRATDLPTITTAQAAKLHTLPVIRTTREKAWRYLGFKHVNGPARWGSYAKARYIAEVHNTHNVPLGDIADQIGDKHGTVQRLYRALMVIQQAESAGVFTPANRTKKNLSFSHLYTGLDYDGIAEFIQLKDQTAESHKPVPQNRLKHLGELCTWLYGDRTLEKNPVVESQNPHLRQLNEVLKSTPATASLRAGLPLSVALDVSYGDEHVFQSALRMAKESLQKARATVSTGFSADDKELLRLAQQITDISFDLLEEMERKTPKRRSQRKREGKAE